MWRHWQATKWNGPLHWLKLRISQDLEIAGNICDNVSTQLNNIYNIVLVKHFNVENLHIIALSLWPTVPFHGPYKMQNTWLVPIKRIPNHILLWAQCAVTAVCFSDHAFVDTPLCSSFAGIWGKHLNWRLWTEVVSLDTRRAPASHWTKSIQAASVQF